MQISRCEKMCHRKAPAWHKRRTEVPQKEKANARHRHVWSEIGFRVGLEVYKFQLELEQRQSKYNSGFAVPLVPSFS